jgi:hypothetical protein
MTPEFVAGLWVGEGYFGISVRKHRKTYRHRISMLPAASMGMNDVDVVEAVAECLREYGIPHWVFRHKAKRYAQINIHGLRRLNVFLPWIVPNLIGTKVQAAENLYSYVQYRLSLPHQAPITERDLDYVRTARSLNGWQGLSRTEDLDTLSRILRDCTSDTRTRVKIQSELARDRESAAEMTAPVAIGYE